jgi:hypothetical protein
MGEERIDVESLPVFSRSWGKRDGKGQREGGVMSLVLAIIHPGGLVPA